MYKLLKMFVYLTLTFGLLNCGKTPQKDHNNVDAVEVDAGRTVVDAGGTVVVDDGGVVVDPVIAPPVDILPPLPFPVPVPIKTGNPDEEHTCDSDADGDGACDGEDRCPGFDDRIDVDNDGAPEACDCNDTDPAVFPGGPCNTVDNDENECTADICDPEGSRECLHTAEEDLTPCGEQSPRGICDRPDACFNGACVDVKEPTTFQCDNFNSECNPPDFCNGVDDDCPSTYTNVDVPCGGDPDRQFPCDAQDTCDGIGNCIDNVRGSDYLCNTADDSGCDSDDYCNGFDKTCENNVQGFGVQCGSSAQGPCDLQDICNGEGACIDTHRLQGTVCRRFQGRCAETQGVCDGETDDCPDGVIPPAGTPCGPQNQGICDGLGSCNLDECANGTGTEPDADSDGFSEACDCNDADPTIYPGQPCAPAGTCSVSVCIGVGENAGLCEIENFDAGTPCGVDSTSICQNNPTCDGNGVCDSDFRSSNFPCRPTAGDCDITEYCTGSSATCPSDSIQPAGTICEDATICSTAATCDGTTTSCPDNAVDNDGLTNQGCSTDCGSIVNGTIICAEGIGYCFVTTDLTCAEGATQDFGDENDDNLGQAVSIWGEWGAASAPDADGLSGTEDDRGVVYLYQFPDDSNANTGTTTAVEDPTSATSNSSENFGASISLWDDTLVVGAPLGDSSDSSKNNVGRVYTFINTLGTWNNTSTIYGPTGSDDDGDNYFGAAVSTNGQRLVVGAPNKNDTDDDNSGAAYVYSSSGVGLWTLSFTSYGDSSDDNYGESVSIASDNWFAVGAPSWNNDQGKVVIYDGSFANQSGNTGVDTDDDGSNDIGYRPGDTDPRLGASVSINDRFVLVGLPNTDGDGTERGRVKIALRNDISGTNVNIDPVLTNDLQHFGTSVNLDRTPGVWDTFVVSAPDYDVSGDNNRGAVAFYTLNAQEQTLVNPQPDDFVLLIVQDGTGFVIAGANAQFGGGNNVDSNTPLNYSGPGVDVNSNRVIVGAPLDDSNGDSSGTVTFFFFPH